MGNSGNVIAYFPSWLSYIFLDKETFTFFCSAAFQKASQNTYLLTFKINEVNTQTWKSFIKHIKETFKRLLRLEFKWVIYHLHSSNNFSLKDTHRSFQNILTFFCMLLNINFSFLKELLHPNEIVSALNTEKSTWLINQLAD